MLDKTGLDLVNVTAGSFPVRILTQEPAENLSVSPMTYRGNSEVLGAAET